MNSPKLLIEINNFEFIFFVIQNNSEDKFQIIYQERIKMEGNLNKKISNHDIIFTNIKNKIYFLDVVHMQEVI